MRAFGVDSQKMCQLIYVFHYNLMIECQSSVIGISLYLHILWNTYFVRFFYAAVVRRAWCKCAQNTPILCIGLVYCAYLSVDTRQNTTKIIYRYSHHLVYVDFSGDGYHWR